MQLLSNDKFKSVNHRVLAKHVGPRISVACFLKMEDNPGNASRLYGPIKELLSEANLQRDNCKRFSDIQVFERDRRGLFT